MKRIPLNLDDDIFEEIEYILAKKKIARDSYINEALDFYITYQKRKILAEKIAYEAKLVKNESINMLRDFDPFK
jgi:metal-responsive CopG/Arc/MetJ family transcriptional regulator